MSRGRPPSSSGPGRGRGVYVRRRLVAIGALLGVVLLTVGIINATASKRLRSIRVGDEARRKLSRQEAARRAARQGRAIDALLAGGTPVVREGSGRKREVALTFDDGPGPYTDQILDILIHHRVPATFFPVGFMIDEFPESIRREARNGFAIGDHTEDHAKLTELPVAEQESELLDQAAALRRQGAPFPRLFRPPYGEYDADTLALLRRHRMLMVLWTVETGDYERPGDAAIVQRVLEDVHPGAIVLLHDGGGDRSQTVTALPKIIRELRDRGYELVTIPQLALDDSGG